MLLDIGEVEGLQSIYAQALIQTRKDLTSSVQQFFVSEYGAGTPVPHAWYTVYGDNLKALDRDKYGIDETLFVPSLSTAVTLWIDGKIQKFGMLLDESRNRLQADINKNIAEKLDTVYEQGDPMLCAVCIVRHPQVIFHLARHSGLSTSKAIEVAERLLEMAEPISENAWKEFSADFEPSNVSMFRPARHFNPSGTRQFWR